MADFPSAESESQSGGDPSASEASKPASSRAGGDGRSPRTDPVVSESEEATPEEKAAPENSPDAPRQHLAAALRLGLPSDADGGSKREARSDQRLLYTRLTAFETVLVAGGVVLFLLLLYGMWSFLSPPLLALAGGLLMWPLREHRTVRALMVSGGVLLLLWLLADLSTILLPFGLMYVLAYLFDPFVAYLHRRFGISRRLSSLLITALVTGLLVLVVVLLVPRLVGQLEVLVQRFLTGIGDLRTWVAGTPLLDDFENSGLLSREEIVDQINALLQGQSGRIASGLPAIIQGLADSLDSLLGAITVITIMPVVLFYTLKDYRVITRRLMELFPTFGGQRDYLINASQIVGSYLRGQLLVCARRHRQPRAQPRGHPQHGRRRRNHPHFRRSLADGHRRRGSRLDGTGVSGTERPDPQHHEPPGGPAPGAGDAFAFRLRLLHGRLRRADRCARHRAHHDHLQILSQGPHARPLGLRHARLRSAGAT
ncbi:MAG: hypothetical protein BRD52_03260 [Bacteroidetes bacterium SW_4_67_19]|nr:MAG: hypothetical protein BRD52_03260 [Bacteroidetes bacterium SW_4_67_19]